MQKLKFCPHCVWIVRKLSKTEKIVHCQCVVHLTFWIKRRELIMSTEAKARSRFFQSEMKLAFWSRTDFRQKEKYRKHNFDLAPCGRKTEKHRNTMQCKIQNVDSWRCRLCLHKVYFIQRGEQRIFQWNIMSPSLFWKDYARTKNKAPDYIHIFFNTDWYWRSWMSSTGTYIGIVKTPFQNSRPLWR